MSLLRSAIGSRLRLRLSHPISGRSSLPFCHELKKCFSTDTEQTPNRSPSNDFLKPSETGPVYGSLWGSTKRTLKTDILSLLDECNLTPDDIKFTYSNKDKGFAPLATFVQFHSRAVYDKAMQLTAKKGNLYKLNIASRSQWDPIVPYEGKVVVLHGIPMNALHDDIDRFLSGCDYDASSIRILSRPGFPQPVRMAMVQFASQTQAMTAYITKNKGFCLNSQITMQVLQ